MPNGDKDIVQKIIDSGGGAKKTSSDPTPTDIIKQEKEEAERIAREEAEKNAKIQEVKPKKGGEEKENDEERLKRLSVVREKIEKGEALTEEDALLIASLDELEQEIDKELAEPSFNIAGKVYTQEELDKMVREKYKLGNLKISDEGMKKLREDFVKNENRKEANRQIDKGYKQNAQTRQELTEQKQKLIAERARLDVERTNLKRMHERLTKQQEEINSILKNVITKEEIYDESRNIDPEKFALYTEQKNAVKKAGEIAEEIKEIQQSMTNLEEQAIRQEIDMLIMENPQYEMSEPVEVIAEKIAKKMTVDEDDEIKFYEIYDILTQAKRHGRSPNSVIKQWQKQNKLAVKPLAQAPSDTSDKLNLPKVKEPGQIMAEKIKRLEEKMKNAPLNLRGGAGGKDTKGQPEGKRESLKLVEQGRAIMGKNTSPFLKELGF